MKQSKLALSVLVSTLALSSSVYAQSLMKDEVMPVATAHNWTGFYTGLNVGAVNHTMNITDNQAASFFTTIEQVSNPKFTGGVQLGYRRQMDLAQVSGVYGAELSANFSNAQFNKQYGSPFALYQLNSENELQTVCLLELMGGIAADRTLLFVSAGLSWANISGSTTNQDSIAFFNGFNTDKNLFGTVLGAGIEYAFTDKISARFKVDVITPNTYTTYDNVDNSYGISNKIVQGTLGLNYKFA
ncbi:MAG: outer membrane beta-barrel protein [Gammaproteobacteria bacterium]